MQPFFSTEGIHPGNAFRRWREMIFERLAPAELQRLEDGPFQGWLEVTNIGPLLISRSFHSPMRTEATPGTIRHNAWRDRLSVVLSLSGRSIAQQGDREAVNGTVDLVVLGSDPTVHVTGMSSHLVLDLPRERLENFLGSARLFTGLTVGAGLASASLATTYIQELVRVGDQLSPDAAVRMASIGIDLIVAGLADRLAQNVPRSIHGNVTVQRAKAYVEANLGDQSLDPPLVAAAVGVSLRRLQELFHARGRHISDYIWERRLAAAANRLADPACAHLSIGMLAYGSGFANQAHFARRFRERHGLTPTEFRRASRAGAVDEARSRKAGVADGGC